jgi:hypothetical protein
MLKQFFVLMDRDKQFSGDKNCFSKLKNNKEVKVGNHTVLIEKKIAEGGYADIFRAHDSNNVYALKRMFVPRGNGVSTNLNQILASNEDIIRKSF